MKFLEESVMFILFILLACLQSAAAELLPPAERQIIKEIDLGSAKFLGTGYKSGIESLVFQSGSISAQFVLNLLDPNSLPNLKKLDLTEATILPPKKPLCIPSGPILYLKEIILDEVKGDGLTADFITALANHTSYLSLIDTLIPPVDQEAMMRRDDWPSATKVCWINPSKKDKKG